MSEPDDTIQKEKGTTQKRFNWRGFFSLLLFGSFSLLAFSGIILYLTPKGRVANWTGWTMLGLEKEEWSSTHITLALLVLIASGFHLYYNWSVFWRYIKRKADLAFNLKRELFLAVLLCILTFFGTLYGVPPFSIIIQWNDDIKDYWEVRAAAPPVPHAEELTIEQLASKVGMPLEEVTALLADAGYPVEDASMSVSDFANKNTTTPDKIFTIIQPKRQAQSGGGHGKGLGAERGNAAGTVGEMGAGHGQRESSHRGMGYGRMSVQQCCDNVGIPVVDGIARLKEAGITAAENEVLRTIAERENKTPSEIAEIIQEKK